MPVDFHHILGLVRAGAVQGEQRLLGVPGLAQHLGEGTQAQPLHRHTLFRMRRPGNESAQRPLPSAALLLSPQGHLALDEFIEVFIHGRGPRDLGPVLQGIALIPAVIRILVMAGRHGLDARQCPHQSPGSEVFAEAFVGELEGALSPDVPGLAEIERRQEARYALFRALGELLQILGQPATLAARANGVHGGGAPIAMPDGQRNLLQDAHELVFLQVPAPGMSATTLPLPFMDGRQEVGIDLVEGVCFAEVELTAAMAQGHQVVEQWLTGDIHEVVPIQFRRQPLEALATGRAILAPPLVAAVFGEQSLGIVVCVSLPLRGEIRQHLQVLPGAAQFGEVVTRGQQDETILIGIKFRMPIAEVDRLVTYHLEIRMDRNRPIVEREILKYKRGRYGSPCHFLDFEHGEGFAITNEEDFDKEDEDLNREFQELDSPDILAIKGIGQFNRFKAANAFRKLLENWHVSDFHIDAARGDKDAGYAEHLSVSGDNLVLVAQFLYEEHREAFERVLECMKQRVPGVAEIEVKQTIDGRLVLLFWDGSFKKPFIDRYVSDGTIKMFAYLLLLNDPVPHPLLCVEEPENQLYPTLMAKLSEEFLEYSARGGQVFVSTHSPDFLNEVPLDGIYWLEKVNGVTRVHRASEDQQLVDLIEEGDKPGYLWKQRLFGETFF